MSNRADPIISEHSYNTSIDLVWNALTNLEDMKQWYFDNIDAFVPELGAESTFVIEHEGLTFTHRWKITEVIPVQKIAYDWWYTEYEGKGHVTFDLWAEADKVGLRLTNTGLDSFPAHINAFSRESGEAGWNYLLGTRLREYLSS